MRSRSTGIIFLLVLSAAAIMRDVPVAHAMAADASLAPTSENYIGVRYKALLAEDELSETGWALLFGGSGLTNNGEYEPHFINLMIKAGWTDLYESGLCASGFPPKRETRSQFTVHFQVDDYEDSTAQDNDIGAWSKDPLLLPLYFTNIDSTDPKAPDMIAAEYQVDKAGSLEGREVELSVERGQTLNLPVGQDYFKDPDSGCSPHSQADILYRQWTARLQVPSLGIDSSVDFYINANQGDKINGNFYPLNFMWENYRRPAIESDRFKVIIFDPEVQTIGGQWKKATRFLVDYRTPWNELPLNEKGQLVGGYREVDYKGQPAIEASFGYGYTDYVVDGDPTNYEPTDATKGVIDLSGGPIVIHSQIQLTKDLTTEVSPYIMQDSGGRIWVLFWSDRDSVLGIWAVTSNDNGDSWSQPRQLSPPLQTIQVRGVSMMEDSLGRLWIAWSSGSVAGGDNNLYYIISADGGVTWSDPQRPYFGDTPLNGYLSPSIVEAFGKIWLFFRWYAGQNREEIMLVTSADSGTTWSSPQLFVTNPGSDDHPFAFLDSSGELWVLWTRDYEWAGFNRDVWCETTDDGANWSPEAQLTSSQAFEAFPSMVESSGTLYVFFSYISDPSSDDIGIWYVTSSDRATWSSPEELVTEHNANPLRGWGYWIDQAAESIDGTVCVVWASNRAGNYDIWYTHETTWWAVVIGIDEYSLPGARSNTGPAGSATKFYDLLVGSFGVPQDHINKGRGVLADWQGTSSDDVTLDGFEDMMKWLKATAKPEDTVILYFAGHGASNPTDFNDPQWLVLHDKYESDNSLSDYVNQIQSNSLVVILDVSLAGGFIRDNGQLSDLALRNGDPATGRIVLTACGEINSVVDVALGLDSRNWPFLSLSPVEMAFSHYFIEGLSSVGDSNHDGMASVEEGFAYAEGRLGRMHAGWPYWQEPQIYDAYPSYTSNEDQLVLAASTPTRSSATLMISAHSPVSLLVTDSLGRRVGYDPTQGSSINEIPGATYSGLGSDPQVVALQNPLDGSYRVDVNGVADGEYIVEMDSLDSEGALTDALAWDGIASLGKRDTYPVQLLAESGTLQSVIAVSTEPTSGPSGTIVTVSGTGFDLADEDCTISSLPTGLVSDPQCTASGGLASGSFTVGPGVDGSYMVIVRGTQTGDTGTVPFAVQPPYAAVVRDASVVPDVSNVGQGSKIIFTVTVQNTGSNDMSSAKVRVKIYKPDGSLASSPYKSVSSFKAGTERTVEVTYTLSSSAPLGYWTYSVNVYRGSTLLDQVTGQGFTVQTAVKAGEILSVTADPNPVGAGGATAFTVTFKNTGNVIWSTAKLTAKIYKPDSTTPYTTRSLTVSKIAPNVEYSMQVKWTPSSRAPLGTYTYDVTLTYKSIMLDSSIGNTVTVAPIVKTGEITSVTDAPDPLTRPGTATFTVTVKNTGNFIWSNAKIKVKIYKPDGTTLYTTKSLALSNLTPGIEYMYEINWAVSSSAQTGSYRYDVYFYYGTRTLVDSDVADPSNMIQVD